MTKRLINLLILDESGSMAALKPAILSSFNELIQFIAAEALSKPNLEQWVQFYSFNGTGVKEQIPLQPAIQLPELTAENYRPDSMTPLYDAIGHALCKLRYRLEKENDYKVMVTILTDGAENASREFTRGTIHNIVKELKQLGWEFSYLGTNQDVTEEASYLGIQRYRFFENTDHRVFDLMHAERENRRDLNERLTRGE